MLAKFLLVGVSGVGVNLAVYLPLTYAGVHYLLAAVISFAVAVTSNFFWNLVWTFRGRAADKTTRQKYIIFVIISGLNLGVNLLILRLLVETLGMKDSWAQLLAVGCTGILNFSMNYAVTFRESRKTKRKENQAPYETSYHPNL
ncbi:MAG TPA: GtrA family protein [Methylomusa anaerophila]|nr:GtrA family protein [Methylomusa anaerophila]HML88392.1 GtrA family protein [Methylomusa anaerophila]